MDEDSGNPDVFVNCLSCTHFREVNEDEGIVRCDAFPDGIPLDILDGTVSHEVPYLDDLGIRFEEKAD